MNDTDPAREAEREVQERLLALQDVAYRDFTAKLIPTVAPESMIGVRAPKLGALARELSGTPTAEAFMACLPHRYHEENALHGALLGRMRDYDACVAATETFLPYIDNWAVCDMRPPKPFEKHRPELLERIRVWLRSERPYTVRFGVGMLMSLYLDDAFEPEHLDLVAGLRSDEYYVNMMIAWYFATALAKRYAETLPVLEGRRLDRWTHNKAIQKAVESYRITDEQKAYLKTLRIKNKG